MGKLTQAIFVWDRDDEALLLQAKQQELATLGLPNLAPADVARHISHREKVTTLLAHP